MTRAAIGGATRDSNPLTERIGHAILDSSTVAVIGGYSITEVTPREQALEWAAKIADACRCAQEVRKLIYDPES